MCECCSHGQRDSIILINTYHHQRVFHRSFSLACSYSDTFVVHTLEMDDTHGTVSVRQTIAVDPGKQRSHMTADGAMVQGEQICHAFQHGVFIVKP